MLDVQSYHNEDSNSHYEWILNKIWECDEVEYSSRDQTNEMAANDVPCLCGGSGGHCEYDKSGGAHCTNYDHFVLTQNEDNDKQSNGGQTALPDVIFPKLFEFLPNWQFYMMFMQHHRNYFMFPFCEPAAIRHKPKLHWGRAKCGHFNI